MVISIAADLAGHFKFDGGMCQIKPGELVVYLLFKGSCCGGIHVAGQFNVSSQHMLFAVKRPEMDMVKVADVFNR